MRLRIERLVHGGQGMARSDGRPVFVDGGMPGDLAEVEITRDRKSFLIGRVRVVIEPGPEVSDPPCPHAGACGGCPWQRLAYDNQLAQKHAILVEQLVRIGKLPAGTLPDITMLRAEPWEYRRSVKVAVRRGLFGFRQAGSALVTPVERCLVADPAVTAVLDKARPVLSRVAEGELSVTSGDPGLATGLHLWLRRDPGDVKPIASRLLSATGAAGLVITLGSDPKRRVYGTPCLPVEENLLAPADGFVQPNRAVSRMMRDQAASWCTEAGGGAAMADLYAGSGNFTRVLAREACARDGTVTAVESFGPSCDCGRQGCQQWEGGRSVTFVHRPVTRELVDHPAFAVTPDLLLMDPPRAGAADALPLIEQWKPRTVVALSCDAATFARDVGALTAMGYGLKRLCLADQFPHTPHFESMGLLTR